MAAILMMGSLVLTSCDDDDDDDTPPTPPASGNIVVTSNISTNTTWTTGNVYQLGGRITVLDGATLEIEPGVIVKGEAGTGANATALLVARGGRLLAEGEPDAPIIFTSVADEITPEDIEAGNFGSPNLDPDINGFWGGVIVLGRAPISASNDNGDVTEIQIDGIPTSDQNGLYGGNDPADDSGVLRYISIRHGGTNIGQGNEINGLSLGGVGTGTVIDHIEIVANQDDGVEWFGGTCSATNVLVWNCGDDGIDTDQSWSGSLDNFVVIGALGHAFELDGPEGSFEDGHMIMNGSIKMTFGDRTTEDIINVDDNSIVDLSNLFFTDLVDGQQISEDDDLPFTLVPGVTFNNVLLDVEPANLGDYVNDVTIPSGIQAGTTPQADVSVFDWTWASQAGGLSGL
jgi:hypothetical protein